MKSQESPNTTKGSQPVKNPHGRRLSGLFIGSERSYLFDDLAMMLKSGISIQSSISLVLSNASQKAYRQILAQILSMVDEGKPLWQSLDAVGVFSPYSVSLVRIGEETGRLAENLELIAAHEDKQRHLNAKIKSAISYPLFVFTLTILIAIGAVWFIFPRLSEVFHSLNVKLPPITRALITIGDVMRAHGLVIVCVFALASGVLVYGLFFFKPTQKFGDMLVLHIPGLKTLVKQVEIERFGFLLGTLLDSGLPINTALESLQRISRIHAYKRMYAAIATDINNGLSLEKSFQRAPRAKRLIPQPVLEVIAAGERSGRLPSVLSEIGERYEQKSEISTENLNQMLEPFLLVFVWLGVMVIALAVIVPIYGLVGNLNNAPASSTAPVAKPPSTTQSLAIVTALPEGVPVYSTPDTASTILTKVNDGQTFQISQFQTGWYKITLENQTAGWVESQVTNLGK